MNSTDARNRAAERTRLLTRTEATRAGLVPVTLREIALAFAEADHLSGCKTYLADTPQSAEQRADAILVAGYLVPGDAWGWAEGDEGDAILATVASERRGGPDDCEPPADYYGRWPELAGHLWWEWQNAALGFVYSTDPRAVLVTEDSEATS